MRFSESGEAIFKDYEAKNTDAYGGCCVRFAREWAEEMEKRIDAGARLEDVASDSATEVNRRPGYGITGFMYGAAASIISQCWDRGEEFRRWHNVDTCGPEKGAKANEKPGAVANPAILTIGTPEN